MSASRCHIRWSRLMPKKEAGTMTFYITGVNNQKATGGIAVLPQ